MDERPSRRIGHEALVPPTAEDHDFGGVRVIPCGAGDEAESSTLSVTRDLDGGRTALPAGIEDVHGNRSSSGATQVGHPEVQTPSIRRYGDEVREDSGDRNGDGHHSSAGDEIASGFRDQFHHLPGDTADPRG